jgi:hypothetical protein
MSLDFREQHEAAGPGMRYRWQATATLEDFDEAEVVKLVQRLHVAWKGNRGRDWNYQVGRQAVYVVNEDSLEHFREEWFVGVWTLERDNAALFKLMIA